MALLQISEPGQSPDPHQRRMQETQSAYETSQALMHERKQTLKLAGMSAWLVS